MPVHGRRQQGRPADCAGRRSSGCKASLKLQDYNPKRDFVGWGGEDFRRAAAACPASRTSPRCARVDPDAQAISAVDFDGDGKLDLCLVGAGQVVAAAERRRVARARSACPASAGCRAAVWADYNGDGKPDLLLATPTGPKLFTNLGDGSFRDDSHLLPQEPGYNLTAAAWIDQDGDGQPDILLGNGFHGLRLYRNAGKPTPTRSSWAVALIGPFDNAGSRASTAVPAREGVDLQDVRGQERAGRVEAGKFADGQSTAWPVPDNNDAVVYLYREIDCTPPWTAVSLGSDDRLTVWLNGKKLLARTSPRRARPDRLTLKLKGQERAAAEDLPGQRRLGVLLQAEVEAPPHHLGFEDVSDEVGLGEKGSAARQGRHAHRRRRRRRRPARLPLRRRHRLLVRNTARVRRGEGLRHRYEPARSARSSATSTATASPTCSCRRRRLQAVPQRRQGQVHRRDREGRRPGQARPARRPAPPGATSTTTASSTWSSAACAGRTASSATRATARSRTRREASAWTSEIFNTQAVGLVDLNGDGVLDMVFNNEGQDSCVLLGNPECGGEADAGDAAGGRRRAASSAAGCACWTRTASCSARTPSPAATAAAARRRRRPASRWRRARTSVEVLLSAPARAAQQARSPSPATPVRGVIE